jgi:PAS domain S-box-containing protein
VEKATFHSFVEHAPDMYYAVDAASGCIEDCNATLSEKTGKPKSDIIGSREVALFGQEAEAALDDLREQLREENRVENQQFQLSRADQQPLAVSWSAFRPTDSEDEDLYWTALRDISDIVDIKERLRERTRQLEQSNESLQQFAYLASHDLQEPLRMVASYTELLERRYSDKLDERAQKYIGYATDGAERMKRLINDLLEYSRLDTSTDERNTINMNELIDDVLENLKIHIQEVDADVVVDDLPEVIGHKTQIGRIFQNLIDNGLKFQDESPVEIEVSGTRQGDMAEFQVTDNGVGFDSDNADRIFGMFQRVHDRDVYDGTGAGLALVKKIVESHGGTISLESEQGAGTTFHFTLPVR